jgi:hypothetical protein
VNETPNSVEKRELEIATHSLDAFGWITLLPLPTASLSLPTPPQITPAHLQVVVLVLEDAREPLASVCGPTQLELHRLPLFVLSLDHDFLGPLFGASAGREGLKVRGGGGERKRAGENREGEGEVGGHSLPLSVPYLNLPIDLWEGQAALVIQLLWPSNRDNLCAWGREEG